MIVTTSTADFLRGHSSFLIILVIIHRFIEKLLIIINNFTNNEKHNYDPNIKEAYILFP